MKTNEFFATHPVFSLREAVHFLAPRGGKAGAVERLKYYLGTQRLKLVTREIYAVIPPGADALSFQPDPFLVAAAIRPNGTFSHHSALELLGVAHSVWNQCTLYTKQRRRLLKMERATIRFLESPRKMSMEGEESFATRRVERQGKLLEVTGPERTLVEGFSRPGLVGGLEELVVSTGGIPALDLRLLKEVLERYAVAKLWAAVGWFLEQFKTTFEVDDFYLLHLEEYRPASPQYLVRNSRGGKLSHRWKLILPPELVQWSERDER